MVDYFDNNRLIFFETLLRRRQKRLLLKALFLSVIFYSWIVIIFVLPFHFFNRQINITKEEIILVGKADYLPFPDGRIKSEELIKEKENETNQSVDKKISEKPIVKTTTSKESNTWEYKTNEKFDTSWREKVANITARKKESKEIAPIEIVHKQKELDEKKPSAVSQNYSNLDEQEIFSYSKKMQAIIRSHWSVPEDLALKYGNNPIEVEIEIDTTGKLINYVLRNSSGNSVYDASIQEAIKKSFPFLPPPKNLFKTPFQSAKIMIIFRL